MDANMKKEWLAPSLETLEIRDTQAPGDHGSACDHHGQGVPPFCS
jgi:hypothetical protein